MTGDSLLQIADRLIEKVLSNIIRREKQNKTRLFHPSE